MLKKIILLAMGIALSQLNTLTSPPLTRWEQLKARASEFAASTKTKAEEAVQAATRKIMSLGEKMGISKKRVAALVIGAAIAGGAILASEELLLARAKRRIHNAAERLANKAQSDPKERSQVLEEFENSRAVMLQALQKDLQSLGGSESALRRFEAYAEQEQQNLEKKLAAPASQAKSAQPATSASGMTLEQAQQLPKQFRLEREKQKLAREERIAAEKEKNREAIEQIKREAYQETRFTSAMIELANEYKSRILEHASVVINQVITGQKEASRAASEFGQYMETIFNAAQADGLQYEDMMWLRDIASDWKQAIARTPIGGTIKNLIPVDRKRPT